MNGATLRTLRERAHLTQVQAAKRLGVTSNTVARWERDEVPIPQTAAILARLVLTANPPEHLDDLTDPDSDV